jgi:hypothetical protein
MSAATNPRPVTALLDAAEELVVAGQQAVLDRVDLIRTEVTEDAQKVLVLSAVLAASFVVGGFGWMLLAVGIAVQLARALGPAAAAAVVGVPHLALAGILAWLAIRRFQRNEWMVMSNRPLQLEATDA